MAAAKRPYVNLGVDALRQLAVDHRDDARVISELKEELGRRNVLAARRLLAELDSGGTVTAAQARKDGMGNSAGSHSNSSELAERYEALRATFTEVGSILARWGMTESMPPEMRSRVAELWWSACSDVPDALGRDRQQLTNDMARVGVKFTAGRTKSGK